MSYSEIHIWGDSLARSIVYREDKGRYAIAPTRYTTVLEAAFHAPVRDHSVMGKTARDGLAAFLEGPALVDALCVIEYGGNDCDLDWAYVAQHPQEPLVAKVPLPAYREALSAFVEAAYRRGMHPLLVTPPPLHAERYFRWVTRELNHKAVLQALGDVAAIYRWQERYAIAMGQVAQEAGCPLLDMRDAFLARADFEQLMCVDGIHPNERGHQLIADVARQAAQKSVHLAGAC